jgi:mono/diheme cytochrome c family protein
MEDVMRFARDLFIVAAVALLTAGCQPPPAQEAPASGAPAQPVQTPADRGKYLVTMAGCHDCHSPKVFDSGVPEPDPKRLLSGHPASEKVPAVPPGLLAPNRWGAIANNQFTAWAGPWGVSFTANLTPDTATGLGSWTEEMFMKAIRSGKHQGEGRPILPPMPWPMYSQMTDEDLRAVFAYLRTLPPINNPVPEPLPPAGATQ